MTEYPRLIERAFPMKQASLDSVHEKNVRHGHISTLHIWPARRPLAACRAALIATLLPDPGTPEERQRLCEKIGGKVGQKIEKKKMPNGRTVERIKEETEGGILHWKRETENAETVEWFRQEIRMAYGGRAPRVLDPFAGGGAIPLEAMRLGCEVTAADINPVAWFILKCTLEYPQKLAGKTHSLPDFILEDEEYMAAFYKANPHLVGKTRRTKKQAREFENDLFLKGKADSGRAPEANLAWHVRAWGTWVLNRARHDLAKFYPTYADFEPLKPGRAYENQPMRLVPLKDDGTHDMDSINGEFSKEYLADKRNPRWVAKPTVAYIWARTVKCKNCREDIPLLKTLWLYKKIKYRTLLQFKEQPDRSRVLCSIESNVPQKGGNAAQRREHDKNIGQGTMTQSGVVCSNCKTISKHEDIQVDGKAGRLGRTLVAVVVKGIQSKEFRLPQDEEQSLAYPLDDCLKTIFDQLPLGVPSEAISSDRPSPNTRGASGLPRYGFTTWSSLFIERQMFTLGTLLRITRESRGHILNNYASEDWRNALTAYLLAVFDKFLTNSSQLCSWNANTASVRHTFARFALPMVWDFVEIAPFSEVAGSYNNGLSWIFEATSFALDSAPGKETVTVTCGTATELQSNKFDCIITDPPYYDAIPYSDLMDFYHVWLRRGLAGTGHEIEKAFSTALGPKWDAESNRKELVDQPSRFGNDLGASKKAYENGMAEVFHSCIEALEPEGRLVVVFANKKPSAWETLASSLIRAGFVVDATWPIQTERASRSNALSAAALSSSVWLVCKSRPAAARPGWDNKVMEEMRANIATRLREFWDAGIRGPDFVWAATGPALEAYSKHPVVKKANDPGKTMEVGEFLSHVRRMVVDFVVGQLLTGDGDGEDLAAADRMDAPTAYYLLHRHDFGLEEAPSGACILYATACGLSDRELEASWDILVHTGGSSGSHDDEEDDDEDTEPDAEADPDIVSDSGSKVKLKTWAQRKQKSMGYEAPGGQPVPLIDRIHRLMHLWRAGDLLKVDEYLDEHGLRRQELFRRLLQSLIELSPAGSDERSLLESLSNHVQAKGATPQATLAFDEGN
jgi:adenine-specific DNA methylase